MNKNIAFNWPSRRITEAVEKELTAKFYAVDSLLPNVIGNNSPGGIRLTLLFSILVPVCHRPQWQQIAISEDGPLVTFRKKNGAL